MDADVVVARNPTLDPSGIIKQRHVPYWRLKEELGRGCEELLALQGNVVVFSTKGVVSTATRMANGDFDGAAHLMHNAVSVQI